MIYYETVVSTLRNVLRMIPRTYFAVMLVPEIFLELWHGIHVADNLRVESQHDDAQRDEHRPANGCRVQLHGFPKGQFMFLLDHLCQRDIGRARFCWIVMIGCHGCCRKRACSTRIAIWIGVTSRGLKGTVHDGIAWSFY